MRRTPPARLKTLRVLSRPADRARGWLIAGPLRIACALGPAGILRDKREGDGGTPAGRFEILWAYYRPERKRPVAGGVRHLPMARDQAWCEDPASGRYNRPIRLRAVGRPDANFVDRMWRDDALYDLTFVLDYNYRRRCKGRGSAIFFHLARPGLTPTAGCVAIAAADMRRLAPRLARGAHMWIG
ncbi:MAG: hypothetical protein E7774_10650 [Bradyrhizobium sp.]|nr:MAG: hypothetical protein E7774_10650 [Bradyrhizobium sp.]